MGYGQMALQEATVGFTPSKKDFQEACHYLMTYH